MDSVKQKHGSEAETWMSLSEPYSQYPIRYQILPGTTEPLVLFQGQNRLNQAIGGFVGLSEFPRVIQKSFALPSAPSLLDLNLQKHPQPHLGGRTSNDKNKHKVVSPKAETWISLSEPYSQYPIRYQILPGLKEPLVLFQGQNRLNQAIGGFVGLSEFPQVIQKTFSLPNAPSLLDLNLQPHLGGRA